MTDNDKLALASRLYVRLKHSAGRTTDTLWMTQNLDYAREILKMARASADAELHKLADRFDELMFGAKPRTAVREVPVQNDVAEENQAAGIIAGRYTGSLR